MRISKFEIDEIAIKIHQHMLDTNSLCHKKVLEIVIDEMLDKEFHQLEIAEFCKVHVSTVYKRKKIKEEPLFYHPV